MPSAKALSSCRVVSFDVHLGVSKINFYDIAFFIFNIYRKFLWSFSSSKGLI
jgi:hypothetical protein